jgi:uncharacterized circularly permuted ATP-grasp superfamily protein
MEALSPERARYAVDDRFYDEAFDGSGTPRPQYADLLAELESRDLRELRRASARVAERRGAYFGDNDVFLIDAVPRVIAADEWRTLEAGLAQRARALNAFLADIYGERRIVDEGLMPARVIDSADHYERWMAGVPVAGPWITVAGLDVVRDASGRFTVLEDNVRTPSGIAYAEVAREAVGALFDPPADDPFGAYYDELGRALRSLGAGGDPDPTVVLLSDGPVNSAWFEHRRISRRLGIPIVAFEDLEIRDNRLCAEIDGRRAQVDVVYRRTDVDRLHDPVGRPTRLAALLGAIRRGSVRVANVPGAGVADDKLVHAYVEAMIGFYFGEEPLVRSVPTYDLAEPSTLAYVLGRLDELVVKPRSDYGGRGVVIGAHASAEDLAQVARMIAARPDRFIAQETIPLSRHPTVCEAGVEPRHVDLRAFVLTSGEHVHVVPGGLTRVALSRDALVVNSSQNGGGKDTWVLR